MERAIKALMANNLPPRFKFEDTYASIEVPTAYTQHLPTQQEIEDKFAEIEAEEEAIVIRESSAYVISKDDSVITSNLEVGTANLFVDTLTGNVGIGKTNPSYNLDVVGTANISSDLKVGTSSFYVNTSTSSVGIGKINPSYNLDVVGTIYASGNITAFSDARFKENIEPIDKALEKICSIGGYTYNKIGQTRRDTGVMAQELKDILPEAVHGTEDTGYSVAYGNLVGILIEAIKELNSKVEKLENKIYN
jgi:hypothetical protein